MVFLSHPFRMNIILSDQIENLPLIPVDVLLAVMGKPAYAGNAHFIHPDKGAEVKGVFVAFAVLHCVIVAGFQAGLKNRIQHFFTPSAPE